MFKRLVVLCGAALLLAGCGTTAFTPQEYPLRPGLIPPFAVAGTARVTSDQPSTAPTLVYSYGGTKLSSTLNAITDAMTQQANEELQKNGHAHGGTTAKTIALRVDSLVSEYGIFSWSSNIKFHVRLGDGQGIDFAVHHASGEPLQDLNGCIAEGVMHLLTDQRVLAYLAS
jgi:hypothetical protein